MPRTNRLLVAKNYTAMTYDQFRDAMNNTLKMTAADFAWITGTSHRRVKQWIVGVRADPAMGDSHVRAADFAEG